MLTLSRKARQANEVFSHAFSWMSAIDAVADVYNGVSEDALGIHPLLTRFSLFSGPC